MLATPGTLAPSLQRRTQRLSFQFLCLIAFSSLMAVAGSALDVRAQGQGGGLHTVNPPSGGAIVYGTLENQKDQSSGMVYMLRQVHGHYGDKPVLGKLVEAKDKSSLAAFFTLTDKNFSHTQQGGMVLVATVNGQMMAAVMTDEFKNFAKSEPGMVRAVMNAWHPAGSGSGGKIGPAPGGGTMRTTQGGGQTVAYTGSTKLYPATGGDRSMIINLPPGWKITGMLNGQVTVEGTNGEMIAANLILQGMPQARTSDLFQSYVNMTNLVRQRNRKPQISFQLVSEQRMNGTNGVIARFLVDAHEGAGQCKGLAQISSAAGGALFVTATWGPVNIYDAEQPMFVKIINTQKTTPVMSAAIQAQMEATRQQGIKNENQTKAINAASDVQAKTIEGQRQAFNNQYGVGKTQQSTGNSHMDDINAGSEDMQNYILDRGVVQSTSTGSYGTFSDSFADQLVKDNPDKLQSVTNRQLLANKQW
jgi:hypothetical protein